MDELGQALDEIEQQRETRLRGRTLEAEQAQDIVEWISRLIFDRRDPDDQGSWYVRRDYASSRGILAVEDCRAGYTATGWHRAYGRWYTGDPEGADSDCLVATEPMAALLDLAYPDQVRVDVEQIGDRLRPV